jgi:hypothetical protein
MRNAHVPCWTVIFTYVPVAAIATAMLTGDWLGAIPIGFGMCLAILALETPEEMKRPVKSIWLLLALFFLGWVVSGALRLAIGHMG